MPTAAILGAAVIGGVSAERAGKKGAEAQKEAAGDIQQAAQDARADVLKLFPASQQALLTGAQGAFDIFGQSIPLQQQQLAQGNLAAQQSTSQGFNQAQAALLGLPTQQFTPQGVEFSQEPFLGGTSLFGTPQEFAFSGGETGQFPVFAGLGGSFVPSRQFGQGATGRAIENPNFVPNFLLGDTEQRQQQQLQAQQQKVKQAQAQRLQAQQNVGLFI